MEDQVMRVTVVGFLLIAVAIIGAVLLISRLTKVPQGPEQNRA